jgi:hypothetical protein
MGTAKKSGRKTYLVDMKNRQEVLADVKYRYVMNEAQLWPFIHLLNF